MAIIDKHERDIEVAWVAGVSSNPDKHGKFKKPKDFYDSKQSRDTVLYGKDYVKKQADFTNYDKFRKGFASFDWGSKLILPKKEGR